MAGASVFALLAHLRNKTLLFVALSIAASSMLLPAYVGISEQLTCFNFWSFLLFEFCVGMYFPAVCKLKSEVVSEPHRSTIYNLFRAPMNMIVVIVLLSNPPLNPTFQVVCQLLVLAAMSVAALIFKSPEGAKMG